jgi:hypothetical protein
MIAEKEGEKGEMNKKIILSNKFCIQCKTNELIHPKRNFCSTKCARNYHALKYYHKIKNTDHYLKTREQYHYRVNQLKHKLKSEANS